MLGTKICAKCNIEKSFNDFYLRKEKVGKYGLESSESYRHMCKDCCSLEAKKRRNKHKEYAKDLYFVYFIYNHNNELIYIGKTNDLYNRIHQHQIENRFNEDDVNYIEFELLESFCDASVREIYYINKYKPLLNVRDVFEGEMNCTSINELSKTKIYRQNKDQFKNDLNSAINKGVSINISPIKTTKKNSKPVKKIDPITMNIIRIYNTCAEAERDNNISEAGVSRAAKTGGKSGGFYWAYYNESDKDTNRFKQ